MEKIFSNFLYKNLNTPVSTIGIGLFRISFGLITFLEIIFLAYFNHLIFDPIPYIDVEFPMIPFFLCAWGIIALFISLGYRCQFSSISNYLFWLVFINFTPMQRDFDGGFDPFMIGVAFFLMFMPIDRSFSIDTLRKKLQTPIYSSIAKSANTTNNLLYFIPIIICLGFLYFDSAIHKLFAEHWRNGLGSWLPLTMPYYISNLDINWLLNIEILQKLIGYLTLLFQFTFVFFFNKKTLKPIYFLFGICLHVGITISLNIYPFGISMLFFYLLLVPVSFWDFLKHKILLNTSVLSVFYDEHCPLCNRTVIIINHFDLFQSIEFKGLQTYAESSPELSLINKDQLLTDLYAIDDKNNLFAGIDTYIQILFKLRYTFLIGLFAKTPGIYHLTRCLYRKIADNRLRSPCNDLCSIDNPNKQITLSWHDQIFESYAQLFPKRLSNRLKKFLIIIFFLQLNSTIHYAIIYRLNISHKDNPIVHFLNSSSNSLILLSQTFLGITPHALYLHDHFEGYNKILAITYISGNGDENWLPFINASGRMIAPNWGRVHSMWANIAVTSNIKVSRLRKFTMKVTAFWGHHLGLNINKTKFLIKQKNIRITNNWEYNLREKNLSGEWKTIGEANWHNDQFLFSLHQK